MFSHFNPIKSITHAINHVGQEAQNAIRRPGHVLGELATGYATGVLTGGMGLLGGKHSFHHMFWDPILGNNQPGMDPEAMAAAPDPRKATMGALGDSLNRELQMRRASTMTMGATGGESVQSAGQLLVGS